MPKSKCQKASSKKSKLKKCGNDLSSKHHIEKVMIYIYIKIIIKNKEKSEHVTVLKQFKTNEMFLKPNSYYEYRGDILQHSDVNSSETQSRMIPKQWHLAPMLV